MLRGSERERIRPTRVEELRDRVFGRPCRRESAIENVPLTVESWGRRRDTDRDAGDRIREAEMLEIRSDEAEPRCRISSGLRSSAEMLDNRPIGERESQREHSRPLTLCSQGITDMRDESADHKE